MGIVFASTCTFVFYLLFSVSKGIPMKGTCLNTSSYLWYCCDNHEDLNGDCKECEVGFQSIYGERCKPCSGISFGWKCGEECACTEKQRCDFIKGCVSDPNLVTSEQEHDIIATTSSLDQYITDDDILTSQRVSNGVGAFATNTPSHQQYSTNQYEMPKISESNNSELIVREIVLYTVCSIILAVVIVLCVGCRQHYFKICGQFKFNSESNRVLENRERAIPSPEIHIGNEVQLYEEIDELTMYHEPLNGNDRSSFSSSENDANITDEDGYLNPYQPVLPDTEKHEYTCINGSSDSGESKNSEYLNPYQPIVSVYDSHEYKTILDASGKLESQELYFEDIATNGRNTIQAVMSSNSKEYLSCCYEEHKSVDLQETENGTDSHHTLEVQAAASSGENEDAKNAKEYLPPVLRLEKTENSTKQENSQKDKIDTYRASIHFPDKNHKVNTI